MDFPNETLIEYAIWRRDQGPAPQVGDGCTSLRMKARWPYIPLLVLGARMPDADVPGAGASAEPWLSREGSAAFGSKVADPGEPGNAPKLCGLGTPIAPGFVMPSAPALTGGVPSGRGTSSAPELVVGGTELWSCGLGMMMLLLAPWPIGLAACAVLAPRSKAAAARNGNAAFM